MAEKEERGMLGKSLGGMSRRRGESAKEREKRKLEGEEARKKKRVGVGRKVSGMGILGILKGQG